MRNVTVTRMLPTSAEILTKEITAVNVVVTVWEHIDRPKKASKLELFIFVMPDT